MRRRLVWALVGVAVVSLILYATPRAFAVDALVRRQERHALNRAADLMVRLVAARLDQGEVVDAGFVHELAGPGEQVVVRLPGGGTVRSGPAPDGNTVAVNRPLPTGGDLRLRIATDAVDQRIADALVSRLLTAAAVIAFAVVLATLVARRLSAPFTALVAYTDHLGTGHERPLPRSTVPEADRLAEALARSRSRIDELVQREREFSANASHQLRTPLTALRLRLEDLATWDATSEPVREELAAALGETDRLAATIDGMLELARSGAIGDRQTVDLVPAVHGAVARCAAQFARAGRALTATTPPAPAVAAASPTAVDQILAVLIENAFVHGAGTTSVGVTCAEDAVTIRVTDEGSLSEGDGVSIFERSVRSHASPGSGIGLALARSIVESAGGGLALAGAAPTTFEVTLPRSS